jgi:hypothetical protein
MNWTCIEIEAETPDSDNAIVGSVESKQTAHQTVRRAVVSRWGLRALAPRIFKLKFEVSQIDQSKPAQLSMRKSFDDVVGGTFIIRILI